MNKLWFNFGTGKQFRYLAIHDICRNIDVSRRTALPVFHALTGCDQRSFLASIGKKSAYDKWTNHPEVTRTLCNLGEAPDTLASDDIKVIEAFIFNLYSSICPSIEVDNSYLHRKLEASMHYHQRRLLPLNISSE